MSPPEFGDLLQRFQSMQSEIAKLQEELRGRRFEGTSGAGMVKAVATGELRIVELEIEPSLVEGGDRAMLQDLTAAAVNNALETAQRGVQERMQQLTGGLGIPGLGGLGGPGG